MHRRLARARCARAGPVASPGRPGPFFPNRKPKVFTVQLNLIRTYLEFSTDLMRRAWHIKDPQLKAYYVRLAEKHLDLADAEWLRPEPRSQQATHNFQGALRMRP